MPSDFSGTAAYPPRPDSYDKKVALVLQGGGALGSYQAGAYEALARSEYVPDWVAGISIGAINAAIIAGNAPDRRVARLREFWERVTAPPMALRAAPPWMVPHNPQLSSLNALFCGQSGFFAPRPLADFWFGKDTASFYDTRQLKATLERLVDFDRINAREIQFSVGAVNVRTGNFAYFNNAETQIRPEHVMASGALPPGFPAVEIDGEHYWDGGLVSNTPLQHVMEHTPRRSRLTFQVDVFPAQGDLPKSLEEVYEREKDIRYSSRTRAGTTHLRLTHDVRHNINALWEQLPDALRQTPAAKFLYEYGCVTTMDIVQLVYRAAARQGDAKDYEFSRLTMERRWEQGLADTAATLRASPWLAPMPPDVGARTFDVLRDLGGKG